MTFVTKTGTTALCFTKDEATEKTPNDPNRLPTWAVLIPLDKGDDSQRGKANLVSREIAQVTHCPRWVPASSLSCHRSGPAWKISIATHGVKLKSKTKLWSTYRDTKTPITQWGKIPASAIQPRVTRDKRGQRMWSIRKRKLNPLNLTQNWQRIIVILKYLL